MINKNYMINLFKYKTQNKRKNFIQLLIEAESDQNEIIEDGFSDYTKTNLTKKLTIDVI